MASASKAVNSYMVEKPEQFDGVDLKHLKKGENLRDKQQLAVFLSVQQREGLINRPLKTIKRIVQKGLRE